MNRAGVVALAAGVLLAGGVAGSGSAVHTPGSGPAATTATVPSGVMPASRMDPTGVTPPPVPRPGPVPRDRLRGSGPAPIPLVEPGEPGAVPIPLVRPRGPEPVPMPLVDPPGALLTPP